MAQTVAITFLQMGRFPVQSTLWTGTGPVHVCKQPLQWSSQNDVVVFGVGINSQTDGPSRCTHQRMEDKGGEEAGGWLKIPESTGLILLFLKIYTEVARR